MLDELASLQKRYKKSNDAHLDEIDDFMKANDLTNIKDIPNQFPQSPAIIELASKLYRAHLVLKGQFAAIDLALKQNISDLKQASPTELAKLLQNTEVVDSLKQQGEKRAELSRQLNSVTDKSQKEALEREIDDIYTQITARPKLEQSLCSYFQYHAMAQNNMTDLQTLPALLTDLTQGMQAAQPLRVKAKKSKKDDWDEFGDEFEAKLRTATPLLLTPHSDDSDVEDPFADLSDNENDDLTEDPPLLEVKGVSLSSEEEPDWNEDEEDWDAELGIEPIKPLRLPEEHRAVPLAKTFEHKRKHSQESKSETPDSPQEKPSVKKQNSIKTKPGGSGSKSE